MTQSLIQLNDIDLTFQLEKRRLDVFQGFSCEFPRKGMVALMGRSGTGKSTLLKIIAGFLRPQRGSVFMDGSPVPYQGKAARIYRNQTIGVVFQDFKLLEALTAQENVMLALLIGKTPFDEARKRAQELLERVELADRADHLSYELSGGEQQRVAFARALACNPQVLLADEPTGNLDEITRNIMLELLCNYAKDHLVLVVTHDDEVAQAADQIIYMHKMPGVILTPNGSLA